MEALFGVALSTEYDPIFRRYAGHLPVAFLRALAYRESGLNPSSVMPGSTNAARGILQVVGVVREDFNAANGTSYTADDLLNPDVNVKIAAGLINRIVGYYAKHPSRNLHEDWSNPEFVKLLVAGWNAGFSESAGVGKVASYLEARGVPVTHDSVYANAAAAGGVTYLQTADRRAWQRSVSDLYFAQPDKPTSALKWVLAAIAAYGAYRYLSS